MCEVCTEAVHSVALWTPGYITALDMCEVCTEAVHSVAPWTRVTSQLWTCVQCVPKQSIPQHFENGLHHSFGHVRSMYRSSPFHSTLNTGYITALDKCKVWTPLRTLLSIFPQPLHAFMSQRRCYVYISVGPDLEIRQPFHDSIFGTRQIGQPLQGRRISRVPKLPGKPEWWFGRWCMIYIWVYTCIYT